MAWTTQTPGERSLWLSQHLKQVQRNSEYDCRWLAEFALRIASEPQTQKTIDWAGARFHQGMTALLEDPRILRLARHMVLVVDRNQEVRPLDSMVVYEGWSWS